MILRSLLNVLRNPDPPNSGGGPPTTPPVSSQTSAGLNPDQQKVAAAIDKANATAPTDAPIKQPKIHKSIFKAPPDSVLEKDFSVGDADSELVEGNNQPVVKIEDTTKDNTRGQQQTPPPAQKPPAQQKAITQPPAVVKATDQKTQVKPGDAKPFDYSTFSPEETTVLKQMSNAAREFSAKNLKELKELRSQKPGVYYQHQDAYQLDPQYKELDQTIDYASQEAQHWERQLLNIRQGKDWMMLEGFDQNGKPLLKGPFKSSEEWDIRVANALQVVTGQLGTLQQQKMGYGQQYQQRIKQDSAVLEAERAARFAWVADPTKMEDKIDIGGKVGEVPIKQVRDDFKNLFAKYHHGSPVLEMAADMFAALQIYGARIRELEGTNQQQQRLKEDILNSEPDLETQKGDGHPDGAEFSVEGMPT